MKFILAPDSFKESMTAKEACEAMARGIKQVIPDAVCIQVPLADGGEGTMQALADATGGTVFYQEVTDPLSNLIRGEYAILGDGETGVVELASASGLHLVPKEKRNPLVTTTYGTGQLIKALLAKGIKKLIIAIGGSATNDGGVGLLQALGIRFLDENEEEIGFGGRELGKITTIETAGLITNNVPLEVEVACDVTNPLTGPTGASRIYGPQKGATEEMISELDRNLEHYAEKIKEYLNVDINQVPGAGAAGGTGAGLMAFLQATLVPGINLVIKHSGIENKIKDADFIFTGEGSIDHQTVNGKTISGVVKLAQKYQKPVIAFAGRVCDHEMLYQLGLKSVFGILPEVCSLEEALRKGKLNLEQTTTAVTRVLF
ncbi:glycerate kinase [Adhaeribacter aquaticus]|uniref:glycerate kinase n=1 Tax=Adhaeribacter aquaticus TaxID=299567 RepID=UPI000404B781|nr:glycerate kinase [Adhaeribacter aquaticus]